MKPILFLAKRSFEPELMDKSDCDVALLHTTFRQFALLNSFFSASRHYINKYFFSQMSRDTKREYTLLDIGAGACDIDIWMIQQARKRNITLRITALDFDARVIPVAQKAIESYPEITHITGNALDLSSHNQYDFIFSNHLLHHLDWSDIAIVIKQVTRHTSIAFCLNDLKRSYFAYFGYTFFTGLFIKNSFAFFDGRLSIKKGFLQSEWADFLEKHFSLDRISIVSAFPARLALVKSYSLQIKKRI